MDALLLVPPAARVEDGADFFLGAREATVSGEMACSVTQGQKRMQGNTRKHGGSGSQEHAKAAGGVHWVSKTVGGTIAQQTNLQ